MASLKPEKPAGNLLRAGQAQKEPAANPCCSATNTSKQAPKKPEEQKLREPSATKTSKQAPKKPEAQKLREPKKKVTAGKAGGAK